ncbi:MAG: patatin-like phospholipase family protein [Candidatus Thiodiazotropha sp.]
MQKWSHYFLSISLVTIYGCSVLEHKNASWNDPLDDQDDIRKATKASFNVEGRGKYPETLFVIASSGGGSRAAVFTANVFLKLEDTIINEGSDSSNLLAEVDAISAVSGSTLPTAYYAISKAEGEVCQAELDDSYARQKWSKKQVRKKMRKNFQLQWLARWFLPQNIVRFWFTSYDRSDIMAQVFANTLYDRRFKLGTYTFGEICDDRPNIILNATNGTTSVLPAYTNPTPSCPDVEVEKSFGALFTFTDCEFRRLGSSIASYPIANAVMSSSAFPAAFNYTTLRNFNLQKRAGTDNAYLHLFDGGNHDNLGLESAWRLIEKNIIEENQKSFKRIVVLLIDSYIKPKGVDNTSPEARTGFDYLVDSNFFDSFDSLLAKNRFSLIKGFSDKMANLNDTHPELTTFFYHLAFNEIPDLDIKNQINSIGTSFKIDKKDAKALELAVDLLLSKENRCYTTLKNTIIGKEPSSNNCLSSFDN